MGAKKQRVKASMQSYVPSELVPDTDVTLLDDLLKQLDSKDSDIQQEPSSFVQEPQETQAAKKNSKAKFKERQVFLLVPNVRSLVSNSCKGAT